LDFLVFEQFFKLQVFGDLDRDVFVPFTEEKKKKKTGGRQIKFG